MIVCGVHHCAFGNQEVNEGCLPYRTEGLHDGEGERRHFPNPKCEATARFYPFIPRHDTCSEVFFCLRGTTANVKPDSVDSGHFGGGSWRGHGSRQLLSNRR